MAFPTSLPVLGDNILYVHRAIETVSGGGIEVDSCSSPAKSCRRSTSSTPCAKAKCPLGYTWLGYDQGKIPASTLIAAVPFGMEPWEFSAWWFDAGGRQLAEALYAKYDVHPIYCGLIGPETAGWFRDPIESLDDIAGLKIRFAGLGGKVIEQLGASVTMIPGGEIFQALEKGAIDASEYSLPIVDEALGFDRIAQINYFPGWHQPFSAAHLAVNKSVWDSLDASHRCVFETACTAGVARNFARSEAVQGAGARKLRCERRVHAAPARTGLEGAGPGHSRKCSRKKRDATRTSAPSTQPNASSGRPTRAGSNSRTCRATSNA